MQCAGIIPLNRALGDCTILDRHMRQPEQRIERQAGLAARRAVVALQGMLGITKKRK